MFLLIFHTSILMNCGIVKEMEDFFEDTLELKIIKKSKTVVASGPRDTVRAALGNIKKNLKV